MMNRAQIGIEGDGEGTMAKSSGLDDRSHDLPLVENIALFALRRVVPISFPRFVKYYIVGLFAIVAASVCFPFSKPLLYLLMIWLGVFFLFTWIVLTLTFAMMLIVVYQRIKIIFCKNKAANGSPVMWDRWLDSTS